MRPTWLVAKYTEDLRRREPVNVGVVLFTQGGALSRFLGQRDDEVIDGRSVPRVRGAHLVNYKAWVEYWRHAAARCADDPGRLLAEATGDANYHLEYGGDQLVGAIDDPGALLHDLYTTLVEIPSATTTPTVADAAEELFAALQIQQRVMREATIQVRHRDALDVLRFDYRYDNGRPHLIQAVSLQGDNRDWRAVHEAAYTFDRLADAEVGLLGAGVLAFVRGIPTSSSPAVALLETYAPVIDLEHETAVPRAADLLGV